MAMNDASRMGGRPAPSPVAVLVAHAVGLLMVFVGERVVSTTPTARWALTGLGIALIAGMIGLRLIRSGRLEGEARGIERAFAALSGVGLLAIFVYFATIEPANGWIGLAQKAPEARKKAEGVLTCIWLCMVVGSLLPLAFGQLALDPMRMAERVEWRRVKGAFVAGTVLAMSVLYGTLFTFTGGEVALRADFSYFRTARPSESTVKTAQALTEPLRVVTFFPTVSEVGSEVNGYLRDLVRRAGTVQLEPQDRLLSPNLAKDMGVTQDNTVVLLRGKEKQTLTFAATLDDARPKLKSLDADFQASLVKVLRDRRIAYLTVGHGELNDSQVDGLMEGRTASGIRRLLERLNYSVRNLGLAEGLAREIPNDANLVVVLGPTEGFADQELDALRRFRDKGGHFLMALDPESKGNPEKLAEMFGLRLSKDLLCDDQNHGVRRMNDSDHAIILTNRFSSHPSIATLSRLGSRVLFFLGAGSLDAAPNEPGAPPAPKPDFIVRSLTSTFSDKNGNFKLDAPEETRASQSLAAAVSAPVDGPPPGGTTGNTDDKKDKGSQEMRAVVVADADALSDAALMNPSLANGNPQFVVDALKWLGGEESTSGAVAESGEDVRIEHTKQKDTLLFYSTIFGAPAFVLGAGLLSVRRSRRRSRRPS